MAKALQILGFSVFDCNEHLVIHHDEWASVYRRGKVPDFLSMYQNVDAITDLPAALWYEEIHKTFPDAKVIVSVRDSEEVWVNSSLWTGSLSGEKNSKERDARPKACSQAR